MPIKTTKHSELYRNTDVLCGCSGTTAAQIKQLIDEGNANFERISRITGACSGCGGCEPELRQLLAVSTECIDSSSVDNMDLGNY